MMPRGKFMMIEIDWLEEQGREMSAAEFAFYIRGIWAYSLSVKKNTLSWRRCGTVVSALCKCRVDYAYRLLCTLVDKYNVLEWVDETHKIFRVKGITKVHSKYHGWQPDARTGTVEEPYGNHTGTERAIRSRKRILTPISPLEKVTSDIQSIHEKQEQTKKPQANSEADIKLRDNCEAFLEYYNMVKVTTDDPGSKQVAWRNWIWFTEKQGGSFEIAAASWDVYKRKKPENQSWQKAATFIGPKKRTWSDYLDDVGQSGGGWPGAKEDLKKLERTLAETFSDIDIQRKLLEASQMRRGAYDNVMAALASNNGKLKTIATMAYKAGDDIKVLSSYISQDIRPPDWKYDQTTDEIRQKVDKAIVLKGR